MPNSPVLTEPTEDGASIRHATAGAGRQPGSARATIARALKAAAETQARTNAFIEIEADRALARAEALDAENVSCDDAPLRGLPVGFKDMFDNVGRRCTFGSLLAQTEAPARNAAVIDRLEQRGAITLGALNMAEFALGPTGHNQTFGHCRNPLDPARISGGSSSGCAAAVASGVLVGAVGSDTGGSIRIPSSCCGVVGLKPTHGAVSVAGAMALSASLDCVGPIAATVEDCAAMFDALANDQTAAVPDDRQADLDRVLGRRGREHLRLAVPMASALADVDGDVRAVFESAVDVLNASGIEIVVRPLPDRHRLHALADTIQASEAAFAHSDRLPKLRHLYTPSVVRRIDPGFGITARDYLSALAERPKRLADFLATTLDDVDALLIPTLGKIVPTIAETDEETIRDAAELIATLTGWTRWINYLGNPALSVPGGRDRNGMPVGLQLVGRPFRDGELLKIGRTVEDKLNFDGTRLRQASGA